MKAGHKGSMLSLAGDSIARAMQNVGDRFNPVTPEQGPVSQAVGDLKMPKKHKPLFVDSKAMKEKLRKNMHKPRYDVANFYKRDGLAQQIARDSRFENGTLCIITFNALWIAIDADYNKVDVLTDAHPVFIIAENFFCLFFTVEVTIRFAAFKNKLNCLRDRWFVFDTFMVFMMIFETWVMTLVLIFVNTDDTAGGENTGIGNASLLRLLRLLRLSRMARMARLLRSMPELLILIKGMIAAIRSVFFTLLLLFLLLYVWAILFRQVTKDSNLGELKFRNIPTSAHSLVLDGIMFDSAGSIVEGAIDENMYALVPLFYIFILQAAFTVMNMLIGVLCEVINAVAATEHEELTIVYVTDRLKGVVDRILQQDSKELFILEFDSTWRTRLSKKFKDLKNGPLQLDIDQQDQLKRINVEDVLGIKLDFSSGELDPDIPKERFPLKFKADDKDIKINKEKFLDILQEKEAASLLSEVGVDVFGVVDLIDTIFATEHGTDRVLSFGDLVEVMMDQRNSNTATVKDITALRKYVRGRIDRLECSMESHVLAMGSMIEKALGMDAGSFLKEAERAKHLAESPCSPVRKHSHDGMQKLDSDWKKAKGLVANVIGKHNEQPDSNNPSFSPPPTPPSGFGSGPNAARLIERYSVTRTEEKVHEVWEQVQSPKANKTSDEKKPSGTSGEDIMFEEGTEGEDGHSAEAHHDSKHTTRTRKKRIKKKTSMSRNGQSTVITEASGLIELMDDHGEDH